METVATISIVFVALAIARLLTGNANNSRGINWEAQYTIQTELDQKQWLDHWRHVDREQWRCVGIVSGRHWRRPSAGPVNSLIAWRKSQGLQWGQYSPCEPHGWSLCPFCSGEREYKPPSPSGYFSLRRPPLASSLKDR